MTIQVVPAYDATHQNISHLPRGQSAGYTTGPPSIRWTEEDWLAHPGAIRICQDAGATDHTADWLDVERYAATLADIPSWCYRAKLSFRAVERPGQREPAIYSSASNIRAVVNVLVESKTTGVFLVVANWNLDDAQANADVENASGPYPVVGVQWRSGSQINKLYDIDTMSKTWLTNVSHVAPVVTGPFLHHTNGSQSLQQIGVDRKEGTLPLVTYTAEHYTTADINALAALTLPAGVPYYTRNP